MWMPILVFFYMGFEHSVVNMYLFPSGLMLGGKFTLMDYLLWNEIPCVIGNLVGGLTFVGMTLYITHYKPSPSRSPIARNARPALASATRSEGNDRSARLKPARIVRCLRPWVVDTLNPSTWRQDDDAAAPLLPGGSRRPQGPVRDSPYLDGSPIGKRLKALVDLRVSQINGCALTA